MALASVDNLRKAPKGDRVILWSYAQRVAFILILAPMRFWVYRSDMIPPEASKEKAPFFTLHIRCGTRVEPVEAVRMWATAVLELKTVPEVAQSELLSKDDIA